MTENDWLRLNRANWDDRVPVHADSAFYDLPGFRAGASTLLDLEQYEVGDVAGRSLLHLQCHMGQSTLSWARLGATVTGLDFSAPAIDTARALAAETGLAARFVVGDVYDAVAALGGQRFDVVYTGLGALVWLPDVDRWAATVADLLVPGGFLYLAEFHPLADTLGPDGRTVAADYFDPVGRVYDEPGTYTGDGAVLANNRTVQWQHPLGAVLTALAAAGLRLEFLHEWDFTLFAAFPALRRDGAVFRLPDGQPRVPLLYSLRASR